MLSENLQIFRDTYELCAQMYKAMPDVPKHARYGEYGRAVSMSLEALDQIYVANSDREQRPAALTRYLQLIGGVRSRVRLFKELKVLSARQTVNMMYLIDKVSKQATGWRNASHGQSRQGTSKTGEPHF
jgi:hypothetical protein